MLPLYIYDIEVFPNFFSVIFLNYETGELHTFVLFGQRDDLNSLRRFLSEPKMLVGYNNIDYDGAILTFIMQHKRIRVEEFYTLSQRLIDDDARDDRGVMNLRWNWRMPWKQTDLQRIMAFDRWRSLKEVAVALKWKRIQDLPYHYTHIVVPEEVETILEYNVNDVQITKAFYEFILPEIKLREDVGSLYGVNVLNSSRSGIANKILAAIYTKQTGIPLKELKNLRTEHIQFHLYKCFGANIEFQTSELQALKERISTTLVHIRDRFKYKEIITFDGVTYDVGVGGLHSRDKPGIFRTDDASIVRDADVASYYPAIMLNNGFKPAHLGDSFSDIFRQLTDERLQAKRSGDKVKADALKITINSIFGKLAAPHFWLQDQIAFTSVTVSGQLYLLMLIEQLSLAGIRTISANTDGIVCRVPHELENVYFEVCKRWEHQTDFVLEFSDYELYVRNDVNNYITVKSDGKVKEKGKFFTGMDLSKGYKYPIVAKALRAYFVDDVPIEETLRGCVDILEFCLAHKSARKFQIEYHTLDGKRSNQQRTNRYFVCSKGGGALVKLNTETGQRSGVPGVTGFAVEIVNDYDEDKPFADYQINWDYYIKETRKIVHAIKPPWVQMSLF